LQHIAAAGDLKYHARILLQPEDGRAAGVKSITNCNRAWFAKFSGSRLQ